MPPHSKRFAIFAISNPVRLTDNNPGFDSEVSSVKIIEALEREQLAAIRKLFREYAASLEIDLCFQGFEEELAELPGRYALPEGRLFLAVRGNNAVGCVGLRKIATDFCEMKRLYVQPRFRRTGAGRCLAQSAIDAARFVGYSRMRLDTLDSMNEAIALYQSLGFQRIPPYYNNPSSCAIFMELKL